MRLEVREVSELRIAQNARQGADPLPTVERVRDRWWTFSRPASLEAPGIGASGAGISIIFFYPLCRGDGRGPRRRRIIIIFFCGSLCRVDGRSPRRRCKYGGGSSEQQQQPRLGTSYLTGAGARGFFKLEPQASKISGSEKEP